MTEDHMRLVFKEALRAHRVREVWEHLQTGGEVSLIRGARHDELRFSGREGISMAHGTPL